MKYYDTHDGGAGERVNNWEYWDEWQAEEEPPDLTWPDTCVCWAICALVGIAIAYTVQAVRTSDYITWLRTAT